MKKKLIILLALMLIIGFMIAINQDKLIRKTLDISCECSYTLVEGDYYSVECLRYECGKYQIKLKITFSLVLFVILDWIDKRSSQSEGSG